MGNTTENMTATGISAVGELVAILQEVEYLAREVSDMCQNAGFGCGRSDAIVSKCMEAIKKHGNKHDSFCLATPQQQLEHTLSRWVFQSHKRQFQGEDYQAICWDFLNSPTAHKLGLTADNEDVWREVESAPRPDCDCGFCESAPWE